LASKGREVTIVEMRDEIAHDSVTHIKYYLLERLHKQKVRMITNTNVIAFDTASVIVEDPTGRKKLQGFDSVIVAMGLVSPKPLANELEGNFEKVFIIGDAATPGRIMDAVMDACNVCSKVL
jgi:thioredoxin reductase